MKEVSLIDLNLFEFSHKNIQYNFNKSQRQKNRFTEINTDLRNLLILDKYLP